MRFYSVRRPSGCLDPPTWLRVLSLLCWRYTTPLIFKAGDLSESTMLHECLSEITLLSQNGFVQLWHSKTEVQVFAPDQTSRKDPLTTWNLPPKINFFTFDNHLKFAKQVNTVDESCYFHLRSIKKKYVLCHLPNNWKWLFMRWGFGRLPACYFLCYLLSFSLSQAAISRLRLSKAARQDPLMPSHHPGPGASTVALKQWGWT